MAGRRIRYAVLGGLAVVGSQRLARRSGVTASEANSRLPGDQVLPHPMIEWTRGITIDRPSADVWPWLVQMGYGRAGWYTPETLDRWAARWIWRQSNYRPSPRQLLPEYQSLSPGDLIPDGPDHGAYFRVVEAIRDHQLVLSSVRHPWRPHPLDPGDPAALHRTERRIRAGGVWLEFSWAFVLRPVGVDCTGTRVLVRCRANLAPSVARVLTVPLGLYDWYETGGLLRGVKDRAEMRPAEKVHWDKVTQTARAAYRHPGGSRLRGVQVR
jgi:hypothetical protein